MDAGHPEIYLYFHGANMFVMTITLLVASPPPLIQTVQLQAPREGV